MSQTERRSIAPYALPAVVWLICVVYVALRLTRGWVPHDEGSIAQSAERLLSGELPHRDFAELYTGGLTYYHAAAFRLLGDNLVSLRVAMFVVFAAWVPVLYGLAARVARPAGAAALTVLAVAWSVPNYPVSLPSWYNLFFATFGIAALLRNADTGRVRWLVLAGVCGGVSVLAKVVGLYFVAAGLLFLVYREQWLAERDAIAGRAAGVARGFAAFVTLSIAGFVAGLFALVRSAMQLGQVVHFVVPGAVLGALLVWRAWRPPTSLGSSAARLGRLLRLVLPFVAGAAMPVAIFVARYAAAGALGDLVQGVLVLPQKRLAFAAGAPPILFTFVAALPLLYLLFAATASWSPRRYWVTTAVLGVVAAAILVGSRAWWPFYTSVWFSVRALPPLLAVIGAVLLGRVRTTTETAAATGATPAVAAGAETAAGITRDQIAMLFLSSMATFTLVQFPFAKPVYFCYVAPTVVLAAAALVALRRTPKAAARPAALEAVVIGGYAAFAVLLMHPGYVYDLGFRYSPVPMHARLAGDRGGLRVSAADSAETAQVTALIAAHARPGEYIYAGPDAPQVYYLAHVRNPTPTLFDFFDDPATHDRRVLEAIDARHARVVVVNRAPGFSGPISAPLAEGLMARFPRGVRTEHFAIGWRD